MSKFKSRKFLFSLVAFVAVSANRIFSLDFPQELELSLIGLITVWVASEAYVDSKYPTS